MTRTVTTVAQLVQFLQGLNIPENTEVVIDGFYLQSASLANWHLGIGRPAEFNPDSDNYMDNTKPVVYLSELRNPNIMSRSVVNEERSRLREFGTDPSRGDGTSHLYEVWRVWKMERDRLVAELKRLQLEEVNKLNPPQVSVPIEAPVVVSNTTDDFDFDSFTEQNPNPFMTARTLEYLRDRGGRVDRRTLIDYMPSESQASMEQQVGGIEPSREFIRNYESIPVETLGDVPTVEVYPPAISFELDPTPGPEAIRDETIEVSTTSVTSSHVVTPRSSGRGSTRRRPQTVR